MERLDWQPGPADPTLASTWYIDADHPAVAGFAADAAAGARDDRERAIQVFRAVRDGVRYDPYTCSFDRATYRASHALARGAAFCIPKAILLCASLRAVGIPSRLGFADVTNHLATRRLLEALRTRVFAFHGFAEAWIEGRWSKATPAFNASLCERFGVAPIEWDGRADAVLQPCTASGQAFMEYLRDRGHFDDFPFEAMREAFLQTYPHFTDPEAAVLFARRDFEADAATDPA